MNDNYGSRGSDWDTACVPAGREQARSSEGCM